MALSSKQLTDKTYRTIGIVTIILVAIFLIYRFVNLKLIDKRASEENTIILDKLRETAKLVIWEQDFKLVNVNKMEKKYFGSELLKFTEKVSTTAKGRIGFHIDLGDTVNTSFVMGEKSIEIHAPLQITYITIDNSTIEQIKESSYDPTIEIDKEQIVKRLNELALREQLKPALVKAKKQSLAKQEKSLSAIAGRKVVIKISSYPSLENGLNWLERNN